MKSWIYYGLLPIILGGLSAVFHPQRASWKMPDPVGSEVALGEIDHWAEPVLWVDARSEQEYTKAHIPSAIWLGPESFDANLEQLLNQWMPGTHIVVYCDALQCDASHEVADRLSKEIGLPDVYVLYEGWKSWKRSGR